GLFVAYDRVSEQAADVLLKVNVRNDEATAFRGKVCYELYNSEGKLISKAQNKLMVSAATASTTTNRIHLRTPHLWTPDTPYLYQLHVLIKNAKGQVVDGYRRRIGVRSFEFKGAKGFFLNGKHYNEPLIGANRHQDFAIVGNALSNSMHWRDAKKLRLAGMRVIRNAHYPQDPAFMDACDELGLFVIVNTPGWQYWNDAPVFQQRVFDDIRGMVRRDRNHPCVWLWEPILNETWYPADFAKTVKKIVMEEYPYSSCYTSSDATARGNELFPILFTHPITGEKEWAEAKRRDSVTYFTREFGDNVDNWNSHNSPSRVNRAWGEVPMLVQAKGYAKPDYEYTCLDALYRTFAHSPQHIGGCLWHSFDHQRGYHPDPFYGGVMDAFRQTKYSYYMFQAQRPASQPMIYIAHAMTPFSPADVTVYSNCDEVRLTVFENGKQYHYTKDKTRIGMPSPIITFSGVYNVMNDKALCRQGKEAQVYLLAEGMMNGKVVASHKVYPARRPSKLLLWADNEGTELFADGSDIVTVVAAVADDHGNIKRLNNYTVKFQIEGEGTLLGDASIGANPRAVQWGTAPVLVKTTTTPGKIRIRASVLLDGKNMPADAMLELETKAPAIPLLYNSTDLPIVTQPFPFATPTTPKSASTHSLKEVEKQQEAFGEQR
ncbi:MAG: glycoside hydrolase family 2 TIM barrel-domain containing protein, partial [Bacteroidaceae bacterium]